MYKYTCEVVQKLKVLADPKNLAGMARFGINIKGALGVSVPEIRKLARQIGKNHRLAQELWKTKIHEARILASIIEDVAALEEKQMERWVRDFDSWDVCDQICMNLFWQIKDPFKKAIEWSKVQKEFVKRAGFALMASLAFKDKTAPDKKFLKFLAIIKKEAGDERNFVKKAVNWALRQIGKHNKKLNTLAIDTAKEILENKEVSRTGRWVALGALRELQSTAVQKRLE